MARCVERALSRVPFRKMRVLRTVVLILVVGLADSRREARDVLREGPSWARP